MQHGDKSVTNQAASDIRSSIAYFEALYNDASDAPAVTPTKVRTFFGWGSKGFGSFLRFLLPIWRAVVAFLVSVGRFLLQPPVLLAVGTLLIADGLWAIYRPAAPIYIGLILTVVSLGLATSTPAK